MNTYDIAMLAAKTSLAKKGQDVLILDIGEKSSFADYFVLASGINERQIEAISDEICDELAKHGLFPKNIEGKRTSGWILMDFEDVIISVFTMDMRAKYNIEKVWGDCRAIEVSDDMEE